MKVRWAMALLVAAFVVSTSIVAPPSARAGKKADRETAEEWVTMALAAYKDGRFRAAALAFTEAHRLNPQPRLVWNIARSFEDAKEWVEAKKWFGQFLREQPKSPRVGDAKTRLAAIDTRLAALAKAEEARKAKEAANVALKAKGEADRAAAAKAAAERKVAEKAQLVQERQALQVKIEEMKKQAAQNRELAKRLERESAERRKQEAATAKRLGLLSTPRELPPLPPKASTSMSTGGWVALTLGALVGGAGGFLFVNGEGLREDWRVAKANASGNIVTTLTRDEALQLQDDANLQQTLGVVGMAAGGAAFISGVILLAIGDPEPTQTRVSTDVTQNSVTVNVSGTF